MSTPDLGPYGRPSRPAAAVPPVLAPSQHAAIAHPSTVEASSSATLDVPAAVVTSTVESLSTPEEAAVAPRPTVTDAVTITIDRFTTIGVGVAVAVVAGCLGPWITLGPFARSGLDAGGDSLFALAAGVLGGLMVATKRSRVVGAILGAIVTAIAAYSGMDVVNRGDDMLSPSPGWGLYLVGLAGIALIASSFVHRGAAT